LCFAGAAAAAEAVMITAHRDATMVFISLDISLIECKISILYAFAIAATRRRVRYGAEQWAFAVVRTSQ